MLYIILHLGAYSYNIHTMHKWMYECDTWCIDFLTQVATRYSNYNSEFDDSELVAKCLCHYTADTANPTVLVL